MENQIEISPDDQEKLLLQRLIAIKANEQKGTKPLVRFEKDDLIQKFEHRRLEDENLLSSSLECDLAQYYIDPYPPSIAEIADLQKIYLEDLLLETRHRGKILVVRTVTEVKRFTSLLTIVEDEKGSADQLRIFNHCQLGPLDGVLPKGQVLLIKEPYYKFYGDCTLSVRIDHWSDVVFLDASKPELGAHLLPTCWRIEEIERTPEYYKDAGNQAIKAKNYRQAITLYSKGLKCSDLKEPTEILLRLNRAHANLNEDNDYAALQDCIDVLSIEPQNEKGLYRKAKALYKLRLFHEALRDLRQLLDIYPENKLAAEDLEKCKDRRVEEWDGEYDWKSLIEQARHPERAKDYDFADYVTPVYTKSSPVAGNGLFASRFIKAGELILCCKAFVNCRGKENGVVETIHLETLTIARGPGAFLASALMDKLRRDPHSIQDLLALHSGDYDRTETPKYNGDPDCAPIIDSFLMKRIAHLNIFGSEEYATDFPDMLKDKSSISINAFEKTEEHPWEPNAGLWLLPSYTNHSCLPNAYRTIYGDMMVFRAARDIHQDDEIFTSYIHAKLDLTTREAMFERSWNFHCKCPLCTVQQIERRTHMEHRRTEIQVSIIELFAKIGDGKPTEHDIKSLTSASQALQLTYSKGPQDIPRWAAANVHLRLFQWYHDSGEYEKAYATMIDVATLYGAIYHVTPTSVTFRSLGYPDTSLVRVYAVLAKLSKFVAITVSRCWRQAAKDVYQIVVGEDVTFEETFGEYIDEFDTMGSQAGGA